MKEKIKDFLISNAEYIVNGDDYRYFYNYDKKMFPSLFMKDILKKWHSVLWYNRESLPRACKDAMQIIKCKGIDFLDILIFNVLHHSYSSHGEQFFSHVTTKDENLKSNYYLYRPQKLYSNVELSVSMSHSDENDIKILHPIVRGIIQHLTQSKIKKCKCHKHDDLCEIPWRESEYAYWGYEAKFFFKGGKNPLREDMLHEERWGIKDGIKLGEECATCKFFNKKDGYCEFKYDEVCRLIHMPKNGKSLACSHWNKS